PPRPDGASRGRRPRREPSLPSQAEAPPVSPEASPPVRQSGSPLAFAPITQALPEPPGRSVQTNRRLHRRVTLAAEIDIDGVPSRLVDISMGGFAAADTPPLASGTVLPVTV